MSKFLPKVGVCRICNIMGDTDYHHIISQNRCRKIGKPEWIYNAGNIIELCRNCHDETTASLTRKLLNSNGNNNRGACYSCGEQGHWANKCPHR